MAPVATSAIAAAKANFFRLNICSPFPLLGILTSDCQTGGPFTYDEPECFWPDTEARGKPSGNFCSWTLEALDLGRGIVACVQASFNARLVHILFATWASGAR